MRRCAQSPCWADCTTSTRWRRQLPPCSRSLLAAEPFAIPTPTHAFKFSIPRRQTRFLRSTAVGRDLFDRRLDLRKQRADLRFIADVLVGQRDSHDLTALGVQAQVQLAPFPPRGPVLFCLPLAGAVNLYPVLSISTCSGPRVTDSSRAARRLTVV